MLDHKSNSQQIATNSGIVALYGLNLELASYFLSRQTGFHDHRRSCLAKGIGTAADAEIVTLGCYKTNAGIDLEVPAQELGRILR